jgi:tRNA threonylcarbamoyladenosine modification (KEOPS) complex Cgi121 subunit
VGLLSNPAEIADVLKSLHATVAAMRASASGPLPVVPGLDMEFSLRAKGARQSCDTLQVVCREHIFVFDVHGNRSLLASLYFAPGVPSLRELLTDSEAVKVVHHGSGDALVLRSYGIELALVFDTALVDALLLTGGTTARHLGAVHDE